MIETKQIGDRLRLSWIADPIPNPDRIRQELAKTLTSVPENVRRVEALVDTRDFAGIKALHANGFIREGRHYGLLTNQDGTPIDVYSYVWIRGGEHSFSHVMNSVLPTHRVIAHVLFRDEYSRVLLEQVAYKKDWELPGGIVEPNEPPRLGAIREVKEELGITLPISTQPLIVDWMPPYLGWDDAIEFIFDGGNIAAKLISSFDRQPSEVLEYHWVRPEDLDSHVTQLSARRIRYLLANLDNTSYTENGMEPINDSGSE